MEPYFGAIPNCSPLFSLDYVGKLFRFSESEFFLICKMAVWVLKEPTDGKGLISAWHVSGAKDAVFLLVPSEAQEVEERTVIRDQHRVCKTNRT